jgi:hypothetical protein
VSNQTSRREAECTCQSTHTRESRQSEGIPKAYGQYAGQTFDNSIFGLDTIAAIQYIRDDYFYDIEVPEYSNYLANDIVSHNCGLGKTFQQLEWSRLVWQRTKRPVLILAPLMVSLQTKEEAAKFSIDAPVKVVGKQDECIDGINVTNYEKLHLFNADHFSSVVLDESPLKNYTSKTKRALCEQFKRHEYKLACNATPAPNDRMEIGNTSEFLSVLPSSEMLERFFLNDTMKAGGYRLRRHGESDFWDWMSSWAVCISKPSDLGFSDEGYDLPPMTVHEHIVKSNSAPTGFLFDAGTAISATKVHGEKRRVLTEKAAVVAGLVNDDHEPWIVWCDTDYEADALTRVIPDAVEVRGSHKDSIKESRIKAFLDGSARVLVTKSEIAGFGLNLQHCHKMTWFAGYSFERFYQAFCRLYRFGQVNPVEVHTVMSDNEQSIADVVKRKQNEHFEMYSEMAKKMKAGMLERIVGVTKLRPYVAEKKITLPKWLTKKG